MRESSSSGPGPGPGPLAPPAQPESGPVLADAPPFSSPPPSPSQESLLPSLERDRRRRRRRRGWASASASGSEPAPTTPSGQSGDGDRRTLATALYLVATSLLFADQNLMAPNLSAIAAEFQFDDIERDKKLGGDIAIAFWMVGVPASIVVGCLADVVEKRSLLFLWVILIGEGACLSTYFVTTYHQLYWTRALTGCSVGGALPLIYSVLGDYYEPKERGWVSGAIGMGCGIGISIGQGAAGVLGPRFGWRVPFLAVSVPSIICAVTVYFVVPEVERGSGEMRSMGDTTRSDGSFRGDVEMAEETESDGLEESDEEYDSNSCKMRKSSSAALSKSESHQRGYVQLDRRDSSNGELWDESPATKARPTLPGRLAGYYHEHVKPHLETLRTLSRCPSVLLAVLQGSPGCVPWGIVNTYLNDFLSSDGGLSVEGATLVILAFGAGNFVGTSLGGFGSSYIYEHFGPRYTALLSGGSAIAGCFPLWGLINFDFGSSGGESGAHGNLMNHLWLGLISVIAGILSAVTGPIVKSTLQNVCLPRMRGQAFALLNTFDDFGRGLGPAFVAWMIERLGGRRKAFNVGIGGWILCGILNAALFYTIEVDEEKVRLCVEGQVTAAEGH